MVATPATRGSDRAATPASNTATTPSSGSASISITAQPGSVERLTEIAIFKGTLNAGWTLSNSKAVTYTIGAAHGISATAPLAWTPQEDYAMFYFALTPQTRQVFARKQTVALRLWLNGGDQSIDPTDLALTILGSNAYTYTVAHDKSVPVTDKMNFMETRLGELGIQHTIPANTWVEVEVVLDQLLYDPDYKYVTGFYMKNDVGFRHTVYLDNIRLVVMQ
jgi:hypothetical protein